MFNFPFQEVDLCLVPYGISKERKKYMDFTYPITSTEFSAIYRRRQDDLHGWLYFFYSFDWRTYLCGVTALVIVLVLSYILIKMTPSENVKDDNMQYLFQLGIRVPLRQDIGKFY